MVRKESCASEAPWSLAKLPAFPPVANQLLWLLADPDVNISEVTTLVARDTGLAAEVLRQVNSAAFGRRHPVDSVTQAVMLMGLDRLRSMTMTVAIMGSYLRGTVKNQLLAQGWKHSLATAVIAQQLSHGAGQSPDTAYSAGLLHDIGRLCLVVSYPAEYSNLVIVAQENNFDLIDSERQLFDLDHCQAGAWITSQWSFPKVFVDAAALHHETGPCPPELGLTRFACQAATRLGFGSVAREKETEPAQDLVSLFRGLTGHDLPVSTQELAGLVESKL